MSTYLKSITLALRITACLAIIALCVVAQTNKHRYSPNEKAFYADPALVNFVRPGLAIKINSASISPAGVIAVTYTLMDAAGLPLDATGVLTPGTISLVYVAAHIPKGQPQYVAYTTEQASGPVLGTITRPDFESGGTTKQLGAGQYQYVFQATAPAGFDPTETTTVAVNGKRDLTAFDLGTNYAGTTYNFVPSGAAVTVTRDIIRTESCDRCHDELAFHGGNAHGMEMCVLCHQTQNADPTSGNTLDLKVMAHKIHMGSELPSVVGGMPYVLYGYMNSKNDFSTVVMPSDVRRCAVCHSQSTGAAQAKAFLMNPTRAACGSCHDNVNFATGANHPGGFQPNDALCANCHIPQGQLPFDASVMGAHVVPSDTTETYPQNPNTLLTGIHLAITSVTNTAAGQSPTVHFTVKDDNGKTIPLSQLSTATFTMAGPTADYGYTTFGGAPGYVSESALSAPCSSGGTCVYSFTHAIPAAATGTYAIAGEARMSTTILAGTTSQQSVTVGAENPVAYFSVDGSEVTPRRIVVSVGNCNNCHVALSLHGSLRNQTEYCVFCHNPSNTDAGTRSMAQDPTDQAAPPQGINFNLMIHRIHNGVNVVPSGGKPYIVVGFKGSHNDFSGVLYPAMSPTGQATYLKNCSMCHTNGSEQNLPVGLNPVADPQGWINPIQATSSACSGCHVSKSESAHFLANTNSLGESCTVCHAADAQFAVDAVHAE